MNFNDKNYFILKAVKEPHCVFANWNEDNHRQEALFNIVKSLAPKWETIRKSFAHFEYLSAAFRDAVYSSAQTLLKDKTEEIVSQHIAGTMLLPGGVSYSYDMKPGSRTILVLNASDTMLIYADSEDDIVFASSVLDGKNPGMTQQDFAIRAMQFIYAFHLFKKYAKFEQKVLYPNQSDRNNREYRTSVKNHGKHKIAMYDQTYYTRIIVSGGFTVSGHFRLQPKKIDGVWTKELIYVEQFEKKGYTRHARIEDIEILG